MQEKDKKTVKIAFYSFTYSPKTGTIFSVTRDVKIDA